jgi:hypothetical protein
MSKLTTATRYIVLGFDDALSEPVLMEEYSSLGAATEYIESYADGDNYNFRVFEIANELEVQKTVKLTMKVKAK